VAIENARLLEEEKASYMNTIRLLVSVIDAKDRGTENHSESVMRLSMAVGRALRLSEDQLTVLKYASLLHDIGKVGIDINILRKPGALTAREWVQMRTHPKVGADIIKKAGFLDELIPAILYHHVRYAGGGYPATRKKGSLIPVEARILSVSDAYESMTSDRPYRKHLSKDEALAELRRYSGTQFDPQVVKALLKCLNK
jgi:putative nucleotidyltransferase with HDIG domain